jgi:signal transduction histidine kinase
MGLGLNIAYTLVAAHGGRLELDSVVGQGSHFTVWLPLHAQES